MNKEEFIDRLAGRGYTKKAAETVVEDFLGLLTESLVNGESVMFRGFGTFSVRDKGSHYGTDPRTHERIMIEGRRAPKFEAGKLLKRSIKEGIVRE